MASHSRTPQATTVDPTRTAALPRDRGLLQYPYQSMRAGCRANRLWLGVAFAGLLRAQGPDPQLARPHPPEQARGAMVQVFSPSPFSRGCNGTQTGTVYLNGPVEPYVAVDPGNPAHLVGVWQQDRWSNGGANGVVAASSTDSGRTWTISQPRFSRCAGGTYDRASDPWVSIAPDGTVHSAALALSGAGAVTAVLASRSTDGGMTWSDPITLDTPPSGSDKESITADPTDSRYVYAVWDSTNLNDRIPAWFARSSDGGASWEPARVIYDPGHFGNAEFQQIVVLPDGTLVDVFSLGFRSGNSSGHAQGYWTAVMLSEDHGMSWSAPILVETEEFIGTVNAKTQKPVRAGEGIATGAVDPITGTLYVVWTDARFSGGVRNGIALSKSLNGGLNWSSPVQVNQAPNVQAFTPAVAVDTRGRVAVTYYDFRQDTNATETLFANLWRVVSDDGGTSWRESPIAGPFDLLNAPIAAGASFLGDYQGLTASGDLFVAFFVATNPDAEPNTSVVIASSQVRPPDTRNNLRTEVNLRPRAARPGERPSPASRTRKARK